VSGSEQDLPPVVREASHEPEQLFQVPPPPDKPNWARYMAGVVGDYRPLPGRLAEKIAQEALSIETIESRERDRLDSYEVSVWTLKEMLVRAFEAGRAFQTDNPNSPLG